MVSESIGPFNMTTDLKLHVCRNVHCIDYGVIKTVNPDYRCEKCEMLTFQVKPDKNIGILVGPKQNENYRTLPEVPDDMFSSDVEQDSPDVDGYKQQQAQQTQCSSGAIKRKPITEAPKESELKFINASLPPLSLKEVLKLTQNGILTKPEARKILGLDAL